MQRTAAPGKPAKAGAARRFPLIPAAKSGKFKNATVVPRRRTPRGPSARTPAIAGAARRFPLIPAAKSGKFKNATVVPRRRACREPQRLANRQ
ncbi:MAG TPA: hypothetical protein DDW14_06300 [Spirochaetaceae bacterium]|nr:hypothetical protein [Spirochaetaceae bacterium]